MVLRALTSGFALSLLAACGGSAAIDSPARDAEEDAGRITRQCEGDECGCVPGESRACYSSAPSTQDVGECHAGTQRCVGAEFGTWTACEDEASPRAQRCRGADDDCDGRIDEGCHEPSPDAGHALETRDGGAIGDDDDDLVAVNTGTAADLVQAMWDAPHTTCELVAPTCDGAATATAPSYAWSCEYQAAATSRFEACEAPERGDTYFLAPSGDDENGGTDAAHPMRTLCAALTRVPDGATLRVAEGAYSGSVMNVNRPIVVKGGFDASFTTWDPDRYPSRFSGSLYLSDSHAVVSGFHFDSAIVPPVVGGAYHYFHHVTAGALVANAFDAVLPGAFDTGMSVAACDMGRAVLACNDVRVGATLPYGQVFGITTLPWGRRHEGEAILARNRVCLEGPEGAFGLTIHGLACDASLEIANNVIETRLDGHSVSPLGLGACDELAVRVTNNTLIGGTIANYGVGPADMGLVTYVIENNAWFGTGETNFTDLDTFATIARSRTNLFSGFADPIAGLAPFSETGDTRSTRSAAELLELGTARPTSAELAGGTNFTSENHAWLARDLYGRLRPESGEWSRGAVER